MHVTDVKMRRSFTEGNLLAVFSVVLDDELALHDIKLIKGREKYIVAMPSRIGADGSHRDIVHPIKAELRGEIESKIIQQYESSQQT